MEKQFLDFSKAQFKIFTELAVNQSFQMLNLLKFKDRVEESGITGAEQYQLYLKSAAPFSQKVNATVIFYGKPLFNLIGPEKPEWDKILIVEYLTKNDFIQMITLPDYPADLRRKALANSRLIVCTS